MLSRGPTQALVLPFGHCLVHTAVAKLFSSHGGHSSASESNGWMREAVLGAVPLPWGEADGAQVPGASLLSQSINQPREMSFTISGGSSPRP